jgi:hypothetical protein
MKLPNSFVVIVDSVGRSEAEGREVRDIHNSSTQKVETALRIQKWFNKTSSTEKMQTMSSFSLMNHNLKNQLPLQGLV